MRYHTEGRRAFLIDDDGTTIAEIVAPAHNDRVRGRPLTAARLEFNSLVLECFEGVL